MKLQSKRREKIAQRQRRQFLAEPLEPRAMLAANLQITDAYLIDGNLDRVNAPILGERMGIRVDFRTTDLPSSAAYRIDYSVDGVTLTNGTITSGAGYSSGTWWWWRSGWFATPGEHQISVTLDAGGQVSESNESDNTIQFNVTPVSGNPPVQFIWPIEGEPFTEIGITNYVDVDITGNVADYTGSNAAYDGHNALDAGPGNFQQQDEGIELYAAADGVVIAVHDGEYDRQTGWLSPGPPANYVILDHGEGWETLYWHMRRDSIQVEVGQQVSAGDVLGYMGSSGVSTGSHVHFGVTHLGRTVEPYFDPDVYFVDPIRYVGDEVTKYQSGVTNYDPGPHIKEGTSTVEEFRQQSGQLTYVWARFAGLRAGDFLQYVWRRPNGSVWANPGFTISRDYSTSWWWYSRYLPSTPDLGTWTVDFVVNGTKVGDQTFEVTATGAPEMRVRESDGSLVVDNRYTPIDFGTAAFGSSSLTKTFTVDNHGEQPLLLGDLQVPDGFRVLEGLASQLAPGASDTFTVELPSDAAGYRAGQIRFTSNDAGEGDFNFSVEGQVTVPASSYLTLGIGEREISENGRTIANVRRSGSTANPLVVSLQGDDGEITLPGAPHEVTIPAGESYVAFWIEGVNDFVADGSQNVTILASAGGFTDARNDILVNDVGATGQVVGRKLFYYDSAFDTLSRENSIASDKLPLLPNEPAGSDNISSYVAGINGMMIDLAGAGNGAAIDPTDFIFRTGTSSDTSTWAEVPVAPQFTLRPGAGDNGSDRFEFTWPRGTITNTWLEVTVKANNDTGLSSNDIFYFGSQVGDTNGDGLTNANDFNAVRSNPASFLQPAAVDNAYDLDRDGRVNASDLIIVRDYATSASGGLPLITPNGQPLTKIPASSAGQINISDSGSPATQPEQRVAEGFGGTIDEPSPQLIDLALLSEYFGGDHSSVHPHAWHVAAEKHFENSDPGELEITPIGTCKPLTLLT